MEFRIHAFFFDLWSIPVAVTEIEQRRIALSLSPVVKYNSMRRQIRKCNLLFFMSFMLLDLLDECFVEEKKQLSP